MSPSNHYALVMQKPDGGLKVKPGQVWYKLTIKPLPQPLESSSNILLRPTHLSLNHRDLFLRQHLYPAPSFTTPLLSDACCTVLSKTSSSSAPQRVILHPSTGWKFSPHGPEDPTKFAILGGTSTSPIGVASTYLSVPKSLAVPCPDHLSSAQAAALPLAGLTAWRALITKSGIIQTTSSGSSGTEEQFFYSPLMPGANLLVTGAGGGVAGLIIQFAVAMGVRVWVTSGSMEKIGWFRSLGAQGGVNYKGEKWEKELQKLLPQKRPFLDAVIDGAGGDVVGRVAKIMRPGAILVSYGMTLSPSLPVPMSFVLRNLELKGSTMGSALEFERMVSFVGDKKIKPFVSKVITGKLSDFEKWEEAFEELKGGSRVGKVVFEVQEEAREKTGVVGAKL